jgi:hypothetical protein
MGKIIDEIKLVAGILPPTSPTARKKSYLDNTTMIYIATVNASNMNRHPGSVFFEIKSAFANVLANVLTFPVIFQPSSTVSEKFLLYANVFASLPIVTLMMEGPRSSETSVLTRATLRNMAEDGIFIPR